MKKRLIKSKWQIIAHTSIYSFSERSSRMNLLAVQRALSCAESINKTYRMQYRSYKIFSMMSLYRFSLENLPTQMCMLKTLGLNITKISPLQLYAWKPNQLHKKSKSSTFEMRILTIIEVSLKLIFKEKMEQPKETTLNNSAAKTSRNTSIKNRESLMKSFAIITETQLIEKQSR